MIVGKNNFFQGTTCNFKEIKDIYFRCDFDWEAIQTQLNGIINDPAHPDYISTRICRDMNDPLHGEEFISSVYYFQNNGVYRASDHWGYVKKSIWLLEDKEYYRRGWFVGFAKFYKFNRHDKFVEHLKKRRPTKLKSI